MGAYPKLNADQTRAVGMIEAFLAGPERCFILKGSAGTGKTTLISILADRLVDAHSRFCLIAPTGRAARILERFTKHEARTIHSVVYTFDKMSVFESAEKRNEPGMQLRFNLSPEDPDNTIFIVDEASMVGDVKSEQDMLLFGSGQLLSDLIEYTRVTPPDRVSKAKILFVGDPAQLPPVGELLSPALSQEYLLQNFGLRSSEYELTETMRQAEGNAVLARATELREAIQAKTYTRFDLAADGKEIIAAPAVKGIDMALELDEFKKSRTSLITYTNAQALQYNQAIRGRLWGNELGPPLKGDILLVNQNSIRYGLANGDLVKIVSEVSEPEIRKVAIRGVSELVELVFRSATVAFSNADGTVQKIDCKFLENLLQSRARSLEPKESRALLVDFSLRHPNLKSGSAEFTKTLFDDPYYGALHVKYGYALTCHKAQGGEWDSVVIDFGDEMGRRNEMFFRWAYTALTRAKTRVVLIGAPCFDEYSEMEWDTKTNSGSNNCGEAKNIPSDPDWDRLGFSLAPEGLFQRHCHLRDAWLVKDIVVEGLVHLPYCERYQIRRKTAHGSVQYWYKGNGQITQMQMGNDTENDAGLVADALRVMKSILLGEDQDDSVENDPFLKAFRDRVVIAIDGSNINLLSTQSKEYRIRMRFEIDDKFPEIDFIYNGKEVWTNATEVGGRGKSGGLIDRLKILLEF
jgi:hypothetical protein